MLSGPSAPLEYRELSPGWESALADFFKQLVACGAERHFHPHPLTAEEAVRRCNYSGADLYYILAQEDRILGYGMLRGWDAGYVVPSLGIAIHPAVQGSGLGADFMRFLHDAARRKGATQVRLKVFPDNSRARRLYQRLGYRFSEQEAGQLVGVCNLDE